MIREPTTSGFLSTLSLRRATDEAYFTRKAKPYFYPRSPCGERLIFPPVDTSSIKISIHALLAESDASSQQEKNSGHEFLSTLSLRRATMYALKLANAMLFLSTLSLRRATESQRPCVRPTRDFYPRSPCGERQAANGLADTPPEISIHALLAESDPPRVIREPTAGRFLSTLSLRRATVGELFQISINTISIHALLAESDASQTNLPGKISISIHALLAESDQCKL